MALAVLFAACVAGGYVARRLWLPPLLGMLLAGIVVGNLPDAFFGEVPDRWSLGLRLVALTVILL
ncbi:MAG: cation:proton antiporter, partial [Acidimicrobiales bacterium]